MEVDAHRTALRDFWLDYPGTYPLGKMTDGADAILILGPRDESIAKGDWSFGFQVWGEDGIRWIEPERLALVDGVYVEQPG